MAEPNILLTRIDNRLIHGQVGMTWTNWLGANLVSSPMMKSPPTRYSKT